jgi:AraC-like DNA-binding protein
MDSNSIVDRMTFSTTSSDEAHEFLKEMYVDHRASYSPADRFHLSVSSATAGSVSAARVRGAMQFGSQAEPGDRVILGVMSGGRIHYHGRTDDCACSRGETFVVPYGQRSENTVRDPDVLTLQVPIEHVTQVAQANFGPRKQPFAFYSVMAISPAMNRFFANTVQMAATQMLSPDGRAFEHPLIARQLIDVTVTAALNCFANSTMTADYREEPRKVGPTALQRAVDYIDEHAAEPISVSDIADASGFGAKELQTSFARDHETTPMEYLRRVRLEGAHRDLRARTPGGGDTVATVAAIAYRWGFANARLFAALYRATYGRAPGVTLGEDPQ